MLAAGAAALACAGPESGPRRGDAEIVVYSGRNEALIGPLLERFGEVEGLEVKVRYASTSELAATLLEEGRMTPADLFISQDAAALGALSAGGMLRPLEPELLDRVESRFRSPSGDWIGLSGRARCLVHAPERIAPDELPRSLAELAEPRFKGRFGLAPTNGSFQAHMAAFGTVHGDQKLAALLAGLAANDPRRYAKNSAVVEAVIAGEVDFGLVNHYYLLRAKQEDPTVTAENFFQPEDDVSSFVNLAGAAVLSEHPAARRLVAFLLSPPAQEYFASETFEYPLVRDAAPEGALATLGASPAQQLDYGRIAEALPATLKAISSSGLVE